MIASAEELANKVYDLLDDTINISKRRKIIKDNLQDILSEVSREAKSKIELISSARQIPKEDDIFCPGSVIVGRKYKFDTSIEYCSEGFVAGFVDRKHGIEVIAIERDGIYLFPLTWVLDRPSERDPTKKDLRDWWVEYK